MAPPTPEQASQASSDDPARSSPFYAWSAFRVFNAQVKEVAADGTPPTLGLRVPPEVKLTANCGATDQPIAALLSDLKERDMLKDTLVVWGGEFGRSPEGQSAAGDGRRHNNKGYSMWMAGGGVKGGLRHGSTDETGGTAAEGRIGTHDLHATMLHLLGIDHTRLTYPFAGRNFRLTDVSGEVVKEIIA